MPIVGGDEIGLDNTCQMTVELKSFFFGTENHGKYRNSAEDLLTEYKRALEEDIKSIKIHQKSVSPNSFDGL